MSSTPQQTGRPDGTRKIAVRLPLETMVFAAAGVTLGVVDALVQIAVSDSSWYLSLLGLVVAPCLTSEVALISWRFKKGENYLRALMLCALAIVSWIVFDGTAVQVISPDDPGLPWQIFEAALYLTVLTFATVAFVVRAIVARSGRFAAGLILFLAVVIELAIFATADGLAFARLCTPTVVLTLSVVSYYLIPKKSILHGIRTSVAESL